MPSRLHQVKTLLTSLFGFNTRFGVLWFMVGLVIALSTLTRIGLLIVNLGQVSDAIWRFIPALAVGLVFDLVVGATLCIPFGVYLLCASTRWLRSTAGQWFHLAFLAAFIFGLVYLSVVEFYFFAEFSARFNFVAVDYLIFPHEVFVNLWDTYPVLPFLVGVAAVSVIGAYFMRKPLWHRLAAESPRAGRFVTVAVQLAIVTLGVIGLSTNTMKISGDRVLNEIAGNGYYTFAWAAYSSELDYNLYYLGADSQSSIQRLRDNIALPGETWLGTGDPLSIERSIPSRGSPRTFNIVLVIEESFGSHFVGSLNPSGPNCTPQFDSLASHGQIGRAHV